MEKSFALVAAAALIVVSAVPALAQPINDNLTFAVTAEPGTPADKLIGQLVYNQRGQNVGSIVDVLSKPTVEPTAILSVPDYAGGGTKLVAVPFSRVEFEPGVASSAGVARPTRPGLPPSDLNWLEGGGG
jgi:hypothetical protein